MAPDPAPPSRHTTAPSQSHPTPPEPDSSSLLSQFVAVVLPAILISAPLLTITQFTESPSLVSLSGWLHVALIAYSAVRLSMVLVAGVPDLLFGVFWVFVYAALAVPALVQRASGRQPWRVEVGESDLVTSLFIVLVAVVAVDVTYNLVVRRRIAMPTLIRRSTIASQRLVVIALAYLPVLAVLIQRRGGLGTLFVTRAETLQSAGIESGVDYGLITAGVRVVPTVILGVALLALRTQRPRESGALFVTFLYLPIVLIVTNPISTNRYSFISATIFLILCAWKLSRPLRQWLIVGTVGGALVLFPYLDYFRYRRTGTGTTGIYALTNGDYDALFTTTMAVRWVVENGITWGNQALGVVGFWVPRGLWANKPADTGVTVAEGLGMSFTNLSSPLWAEGYVNFGLLGAIVAAALFGLVAARLAVSHLTPGDARGDLIWSFIVGYQLILLRGSLLQATGQVVVVVLMVILLTRRTPAAEMAEDEAAVDEPVPERTSRASPRIP